MGARKLSYYSNNYQNNILVLNTPDVVSQSDYYPFGMMLPNRHETQGDGYRYGFQGQEMDDEVRNSPGTSVNYKYRMHDPRVGRFFAVDPLFREYPHNSSYAFSENRVIDGVELEGLEYQNMTGGSEPFHTSPSLEPTGAGELLDDVLESDAMINGLQVGGDVVSGVGWVCSFIPLPQTQAVSKVLIPVGNVISNTGTAMEVTKRAREGDLTGAFSTLVLSSGTGALGKQVDNLKNVEKISETGNAILQTTIIGYKNAVDAAIPDAQEAASGSLYSVAGMVMNAHKTNTVQAPAPETSSKPTANYYTVKSGDNLWNIAKENGTTVEKIVGDNDIANPRKINPGDKLKISSDNE